MTYKIPGNPKSGYGGCLVMAIVLLLVSIYASAQPPVADTNKMVKATIPPDSIAIISIRDIDGFYKFLTENVSKAAYDKMTPEQTLGEFYKWVIIEWNKRKKR